MDLRLGTNPTRGSVESKTIDDLGTLSLDFACPCLGFQTVGTAALGTRTNWDEMNFQRAMWI